MRRALRLMAAVTVLLGVAAVILGLLTVRRQQGLLDAPSGPVVTRGAWELAHAVTGHAAAAVAFIAAAMTFLIGLHGLLETGGKRLRSAMLFVLAPMLMGLALWSDITGLRGRGDAGGTLALADLEEFARVHGVLGGGFTAAALAVLAFAWLLAKPDRADAAESDD